MDYKSKFGFGCMRLPKTDKNDDSSINQELFNEMVDIYMAKGFNYFDTAHAYDDGFNEKAIRKAVVERYPRDSYQICDKMPTWELTSPQDNDKLVNEMLERLGIDYFDVFFIHSINEAGLQLAEKNNTFEYVRKMKENGIAKKIGFSFHEKADFLKEVLDKYGEIFDIVQLELNYLDWEDSSIQSYKCYDICAEYGLDVYVMEPLKGGIIVNPSKEIQNDFKQFNPDNSIASLAIRFCASLEHVKMVLCGMSKMSDMEDNCHTFENFEPINDVEMEFLEKMAVKVYSSLAVPCSECDYCADTCPCDIPISDFFSLINASKNHPESDIYLEDYNELCEEMTAPDECIECEKCMEFCTQLINIPEELKNVQDYFENDFSS